MQGTLSAELTASERENRQQSEVIASLKSDKDTLETTLYETQQLNAQLENRKEQLEGENQELILKKENLFGQYIEHYCPHNLVKLLSILFHLSNLTLLHIIMHGLESSVDLPLDIRALESTVEY